MSRRTCAPVAAALAVVAALACDLAPAPPAPAPPAAAPSFDLAGFARAALEEAAQRPAHVVQIAALVGIFIGDVPQLLTALGSGLEDAQVRAEALAALCDGATVEVAAAGELLVATFPGPCTLPTGVVVEGVVTATLHEDSVDVGLHGVRADDGRWRGFVVLTMSLAPVVGVVANDWLVVPVLFSTSPGVVVGGDDAALIDVADARTYSLLPPSPDARGPFVIDGSVCVHVGGGVRVAGLRRRAGACADVESLHVGAELRCFANADAEPHEVYLRTVLAPLVPGPVDAVVALEGPDAGVETVVRLEVPASTCPDARRPPAADRP